MTAPLAQRIEAARTRLDDLLVKLVDVLDAGERDPTWKETEAIERAQVELGQLVRESRLNTYRNQDKQP